MINLKNFPLLVHYGDVKFNVTKSALNSHKMHIKFSSDIHFTFQDNPAGKYQYEN